jgi:3-oxoacyl-[acyl-carrier-protein] synthase II
VVVTGCGVISPVGLTVAGFWSSLLAGRSGVAEISRFDASGLPVRIAGEVRGFDPADYLPHQVSRRIDSYAQYALAAGQQAVEAAKLELTGAPAGVDGGRVGVLVGAAYGPVQTIQHSVRTLDARGVRRVSPHFAAASSVDSAAGELARRLGARGPSGSVSTACATGSTCIGEAMRHIQHGYADVMLAGGADDAITELDVGSTDLAGALSRRNHEPAAASRPFDRGRDGFVMAAGAGVLVLEEAGHALRRGAPILAELAGYGSTTDVHHATAPHPEGRAAQAAMRLALADAGITAGQVDHVNAHGTGTRQGDRAELAAIRAVLGERAPQTPISAVKSMTGHLLGAAGAVELVATIESIRTGMVPPTLNCDDPEDPELDLVAHHARRHPVTVAISNSFGFAGHNAVLVVRAWDGTAGSGGGPEGWD